MPESEKPPEVPKPRTMNPKSLSNLKRGRGPKPAPIAAPIPADAPKPAAPKPAETPARRSFDLFAFFRKD